LLILSIRLRHAVSIIFLVQRVRIFFKVRSVTQAGHAVVKFSEGFFVVIYSAGSG
jgi:hypothetical protein